MILDYNLVNQKLLKWFSENNKNYLWRKPNITAYEVLVAELLLQRTTRVSVSRIYEKFLIIFYDLETIYQSEIEKIESFFSTLGLKHKASYLKQIANSLKQKRFKIPDSYNELIALKGIGDYIARSIRVFAFNKIDTPIDSNIRRILKRAFYLETDDMQKKFLLNLVKNEPKKIVWALIDLGWDLCHISAMKCEECPINPMCLFYISQKTSY